MSKVVKDQWLLAILIPILIGALGWGHKRISDHTDEIARNTGRIETMDRILKMIYDENKDAHNRLMDLLKEKNHGR